jgi:hypothetical protein
MRSVSDQSCQMNYLIIPHGTFQTLIGASVAGPRFFLFSDPERSKQLLTDAGFHAPWAVQVPQLWRVPSPDELFDAILYGTVRAGATLRGQSKAAREAVRATVVRVLNNYRVAPDSKFQCPAILATAVKPQLCRNR